MPSVVCPKCSKEYSVPETSLNSRAKCKSCGEVFTLALTADETLGLAKPAARPSAASPVPPVGPSSSDPATRTIGRYELRRRLGAGAFGEVWLARDTRLKRDVALKLPTAASIETPEAQARFVREPMAAAQLRHPNIVPVHDADFADGRFYIAYAFIEGETLKAAADTGRIDFRRAAEITRKLADALQHAHDLGIIHRDVKPSNVMLDQRGEPQLMDFGLAQVADVTSNLTQQGSLLGTPYYMSPEQAGAGGEVGPASDQYSLGVLLYELLTGRVPFEGQPMVVLYRVRTDQPSPPTTHNPAIPPALAAICLRAMSKRPEDRFVNCGEMAAALQAFLMPRAAALLPVSQTAIAPGIIPAALPIAPVVGQFHPIGSSSVGGLDPSATGMPVSFASPWQTVVNRPGRRKQFVIWRQPLVVVLGGIAVLAVIVVAMFSAMRSLPNVAGSPSSASLSVPTPEPKDQPPASTVPTATLPAANRPTPTTQVIAGQKAGQEWDSNGLKMKFCWCPPGTFKMGSPAPDMDAQSDEKPEVDVTLSRGFWLGKHEVTQGEWQQAMGTTPWKGQWAKEGTDYAASYVTWEDAVKFCVTLTSSERKAGRLSGSEAYRLPTEAEWEYACRAGTTTKYSFGDSAARLSEFGWWGGITSDGGVKNDQYAHEAGLKQPNAWGLHDMHGNVFEWCSDKYDIKLVGGRNPTGSSQGGCRVARGGSCGFDAVYCRSAYRSRNWPDDRNYFLGFRVARSPSDVTQSAATSTPQPLQHDDPETKPASVKKPPKTGTNADVAKTLMEARGALAGKDMAGAKRLIDKAATAAEGADTEDVERMKLMHEYVSQFWHAFDESLMAIPEGEDFLYEDGRISVVKKGPKILILRIDGQEKEYELGAMPSKLAMAFTERYFNNDPANNLAMGAFLVVHPKGDRETARELWSEAARRGLKEQVDAVLPELEIGATEVMESIASDDANTPQPGMAGGDAGSITDGSKKRQPVPSNEDVQNERQQIRTTLKSEFAAARMPADKGKLAERLFLAAREPSDNLPERYVLYDEARQLAAESGQIELLENCIKELAQWFAVDTLSLKAECYPAAFKAAGKGADHRRLAQICLELVDEATAAEDFVLADKFLVLAKSQAAQAKDTNLKKAAAEKDAEVRRRLKS